MRHERRHLERLRAANDRIQPLVSAFNAVSTGDRFKLDEGARLKLDEVKREALFLVHAMHACGRDFTVLATHPQLRDADLAPLADRAEAIAAAFSNAVARLCALVRSTSPVQELN